jgi:hypothetical protein
MKLSKRGLQVLTAISFFVALNRLREQLNARGSTTIRGLGRTFKIWDSYNGNRKVDAQEFFVSLQEWGVKISKAEADVSIIFFLNFIYLISVKLTSVSFIGSNGVLRH